MIDVELRFKKHVLEIMDIITALMTIFLFLFLFYFLFVHNINPHIRCNCKIDMTARLAANKKKMRSQL